MLIYDKFNLRELAAAFTKLRILIGCDTGPLHLGALFGIPVVFVTDPMDFVPLGAYVDVARSGTPGEISVHDIYESARRALSRADASKGR